MNLGTTGRLMARAIVMGVYPMIAMEQSARRRDTLLIPTTNPFFLPHLLVAAASLYGQRVVPLIYDMYPDAWEAADVTSGSSTMVRLAVRANRLMFRYADGVVFIGENMASRAIEKYGEPRLWTVIETGAECDEFTRARGRLALRGWAHDSWLRDRRLVTYTGNLGLVHDWTAFATGLREALASDLARRAACMICASGPGASFLRQELAGAGEDAVRFVDPLDDEPWAEVLVRSSVSVVTLGAKAAETSIPSKVFSAMAAGSAILAVAPATSDLATLVRRHGCGVVVAPGDSDGFRKALTCLVEDSTKASCLGEAGFAAVETYYDTEVLARRWLSFLNKVVNAEPVRIESAKSRRI
jgi:glycosyltransferase involved in cell wall biosynthesis